jgi:hypothetical protein
MAAGDLGELSRTWIWFSISLLRGPRDLSFLIASRARWQLAACRTVSNRTWIKPAISKKLDVLSWPLPFGQVGVRQSESPVDACHYRTVI